MNTNQLTVEPARRTQLRPLASFYRGKTVIVTGASSGIGQSTALLLAALGSNVLIMARTQSDLDKTIKCSKRSGKALLRNFSPMLLT